MYENFFNVNNNCFKEKLLLKFAMQNNTFENRPEKTPQGYEAGNEPADLLHDKAMQAIHKIAIYRAELNKKLDNMQTGSYKYRQFEKAYNRLTEIQDKLEKTIEKRDSETEKVVNGTFRNISEIFRNPHLRVLRSFMIARQFKEIKNLFSQDIIHADKLIPLFVIISKSDGRNVANNVNIEGFREAKKDGNKLILWPKNKSRPYIFIFRVIGGKWQIFDAKGKPLEQLKIERPRRGALEGLFDKGKTHLKKDTEVVKGPALVKRSHETPKQIREKHEALKKKNLIEELASMHQNQDSINNFPNIQKYLKGITRTTVRGPLQLTLQTEINGRKVDFVALISCLREGKNLYYRISTAEKGDNNGLINPAVRYWPNRSEKKQYYGRDYIAAAFEKDSSRKKEEQERVSANSKALAAFSEKWNDIDGFVDYMKIKDPPLKTVLSEYGFKPPFRSREIDDRNGNRYRLIIENNTLKLENKRLGVAGNIKYIALEKTGSYSVKINPEPKIKTINELAGIKTDAEKEPDNVKEWRQAALKAVNEMYERVSTKEKLYKFRDELIRLDKLNMDGRTIEDKARIWGKYTEIAVRFKNIISYAKENLAKPGTSLNQLEVYVNNALVVLPLSSRNIYFAQFKRDVEQNIVLAKKQVKTQEQKA